MPSRYPNSSGQMVSRRRRRRGIDRNRLSLQYGTLLLYQLMNSSFILQLGAGEDKHGVRDQGRGLRSAGEDVRVHRAKDHVWR
jgi:hypothetical protein